MSYGYDAKDRLTSESSTRAGGYSFANAYDAAGNATTLRSGAATYNADNEWLSAASGTCAYDGNGAPTKYNLAQAYDVEGRLASEATAGGGTAFTAGYGADGILTTPPWDNNTFDTQYQWVTLNGQSYQVSLSNSVKTPKGTVYTYAKEGSYPNGTVPFNNPAAPAQAANVLKVTTATDRQGNVTTYTYGTGTVTFQHSNGTTVENPLVAVSMPGGHHLTLTWGANSSAASYQRVTSISDDTRTVAYAYTGAAGHGLLVGVTTPGGKTTAYGYGAPWTRGDWAGGTPGPVLSSITDPRGLTTQIHSAIVAIYGAATPSNPGSGVFAYRIIEP